MGSENDGVPQHDIVITGGSAHSSWWVLLECGKESRSAKAPCQSGGARGLGLYLEAFEVTHKTSSCWGRHDQSWCCLFPEDKPFKRSQKLLNDFDVLLVLLAKRWEYCQVELNCLSSCFLLEVRFFTKDFLDHSPYPLRPSSAAFLYKRTSLLLYV